MKSFGYGNDAPYSAGKKLWRGQNLLGKRSPVLAPLKSGDRGIFICQHLLSLQSHAVAGLAAGIFHTGATTSPLEENQPWLGKLWQPSVTDGATAASLASDWGCPPLVPISSEACLCCLLLIPFSPREMTFGKLWWAGLRPRTYWMSLKNCDKGHRALKSGWWVSLPSDLCWLSWGASQSRQV